MARVGALELTKKTLEPDTKKRLRRQRRMERAAKKSAARERRLQDIASDIVLKAIPAPSTTVGARTVSSVEELRAQPGEEPSQRVVGDITTSGASFLSPEEQLGFRRGKLREGLLPLSATPPAFQQVVRETHGQRAVGWDLSELKPEEINVLRTMAVNASRQP